MYDMGLLEKALQYKKEINSKGQDTLIDRIQGPAETDFIVDEPEMIKDSDATRPRCIRRPKCLTEG